MNKKIFIIAAIILALTVALTACKSKKDDPANEENTDKVVQTVTVTGKDGGVTNVEIYEDASGDRYITNVEGTKIPLTTDDQGFSDDIGYLVTSKPATESNSAKPTDNKPTGNDNPTGSTQPSSSSEENSTAPENSTGGGIVIGSGGQQDSISWDEIKNPKK